MSYTVSTYFDNDSWQKSGVNWLRKAKSAGLNGFIIGKELPVEAEKKAKDLGFRIVPISKKFGDDRDLYHAILGFAQKDQRCLFVQNFLPVKSDLPELTDVVCDLDVKFAASDIVTPIKTLQDRAKTINVIRDKIERIHKGILSPNLILGSWNFWNGFLAFQNYLHDKNYLDGRAMYHELVFNLYISLTESLTLEINHD